MWILSFVGLGLLLNIQVICNAFDCQISVCTFNVDIPMTFAPYACAPELGLFFLAV